MKKILLLTWVTLHTLQSTNPNNLLAIIPLETYEKHTQTIEALARHEPQRLIDLCHDKYSLPFPKSIEESYVDNNFTKILKADVAYDNTNPSYTIIYIKRPWDQICTDKIVVCIKRSES